jgi:hypothetical protein
MADEVERPSEIHCGGCSERVKPAREEEHGGLVSCGPWPGGFRVAWARSELQGPSVAGEDVQDVLDVLARSPEGRQVRDWDLELNPPCETLAMAALYGYIGSVD